MAIRVTCHSCSNEINVKDELAGKDILCPQCQARVTVPSIASGRPEPRPAAESDIDERVEDSERRRSGRDDDLPRWGDSGDYEVPSRRDTNRWNGTLTGLGMMFWTGVAMFILAIPLVGIVLAIGDDLQRLGAGNQQNPPPAVVGFIFPMIGLACVIMILAIVYFVGMCMCCTVPSESGAKGRALTAVILVGVAIVLSIIWGVAGAVAGFQHVQNFGGPPPPGHLPFSPTVHTIVAIISTLIGALIWSFWIMFHKAIADFFHNSSLTMSCKWYLIIYLFTLTCQTGLNVVLAIENPARHANPFLGVTSSPLAIITLILTLGVGMGLMIWFMGIIRATRNTIYEGRESVGRGDDGYDQAP